MTTKTTKFAPGSTHLTPKGIIEIKEHLDGGMITYFLLENRTEIITNKLVNIRSVVDKYKYRLEANNPKPKLNDVLKENEELKERLRN